MNRPAIFSFRLYVAGDAQNSLEAVANLTALCRTHLTGRHDIEIVDIYREPGRALADGIRMTPTLVKLHPAPIRTIIGTLREAAPVLHALGLPGTAS
jgi:circadian clock protein KaiB